MSECQLNLPNIRRPRTIINIHDVPLREIHLRIGVGTIGGAGRIGGAADKRQQHDPPIVRREDNRAYPVCTCVCLCSVGDKIEKIMV